MSSRSRSITVLAVLAGISACGGGGGGSSPPPPPAPPPPNASPGGIYFGELVDCGAVCPVDTLLLVSESGDWMAMDVVFSAGANVGRMTMNGTSFNSSRQPYTGTPETYGYQPTAPATALPMDDRAFQGTVVERTSISGNFIFKSNDDAFIDASFDPMYNNDSSLQALAGTYTASDGAGFVLTYVIDTMGQISGSDSSGCTANGTAALIDPDFNMYRVSMDFNACGAQGAAGTYTGLATLLDAGGSQDLLFYALSDDAATLVLLQLTET